MKSKQWLSVLAYYYFFEKCQPFNIYRNRKILMTPVTRTFNCAAANDYNSNGFGDIMGGYESIIPVESFSPLERIVLTANGNLQRIMSAYYGAEVSVDILKCDERIMESRDSDSHIFDREVNLLVNGKAFCRAYGKIEVHDEACLRAIEEKSIGMGQLFRHLGVLPSFKLLQVGRNMDGQLNRQYVLEAPQLKCTFTEVFAVQFLERSYFPT